MNTKKSKKTDPNTDGKGADETANAGQGGSETSPENEEGKTADETLETSGDDNAADAETDSTEEEEEVEVELDELDEETDDDAEVIGDDGKAKFTQTELNRVVKERLKKQKESINKRIKAERTEQATKVAKLERELETYRSETMKSVQTDFDALPDEVKALTPAQVEDDFRAVQKWLPAAKKLAENLGKKSLKGNGGDPPSINKTGSPDTDLEMTVKKHSIYKSF